MWKGIHGDFSDAADSADQLAGDAARSQDKRAGAGTPYQNPSQTSISTRVKKKCKGFKKKAARLQKKGDPLIVAEKN